MILNCNLQPRLRLQRHGFQSLGNRMATEIVAILVRNFKQYQGSQFKTLVLSPEHFTRQILVKCGLKHLEYYIKLNMLQKCYALVCVCVCVNSC